MDFHHRDTYYLRIHGAQLDDKNLRRKYEALRKSWKDAGEVGQLPRATLLQLAAAHPKAVPSLNGKVPSPVEKAPVKKKPIKKIPVKKKPA